MRTVTLEHRDGSTSIWHEATSRNPCPICDHRNQGWCLIRDDGAMALCPRTPNDRPIGNYGYLHVLNDGPTPRRRPGINARRTQSPGMDPKTLESRHEHFRANFTEYYREELARRLGVGESALDQIGTGYEGNGWYCWPMTLDGVLVGFRCRHLSGAKRSLKGARTGLILPVDLRQYVPLYIVEGPTDLAAALTIGLTAVARPQCFGFEAEVVRFARHLRPSRVVVVRDLGRPDSPLSQRNSYQGAHRLAQRLACNWATQLWCPPMGRDLREAVKAGLDANGVEAGLESTGVLTKG